MPGPDEGMVEQVAAATVLLETAGLGPAELRRRLEPGKGPLATLTGAPAADAARRRWEDAHVRREAQKRARRFVGRGGRVIALGQPEFPPRCAALAWMPGCLFVLGTTHGYRGLATIVGTRRALPSAIAFTRHLAGGLAAEGIGVASGMALGIDAAAHRGALAAGGPTIAVLATGLDRCYPLRHAGLMETIAARGALLSELPPGTPPRTFQFPARNRILAALADAVVVVQAPRQSGALITAAHALEAGVELLAVPGDPLLAENRGSNGLLTDGARPVLGVDDVVAAVTGEERALVAESAPLPLPAELDATDRRLLQRLDLAPVDLEQTARCLELGIAEAMRRVLRLELMGLVAGRPGGQIQLTPLAARSARWPGGGRQRSGGPSGA